MRPGPAVLHLLRPVALLAVLSLVGNAALVDGQRALASGWPAPPDPVWVAVSVLAAGGAVAGFWRALPLVRQWHREIDAARGEPSRRPATAALGVVVSCLVLAVLGATLPTADVDAGAADRPTAPAAWAVVVLVQWAVAAVVVLTMLAQALLRHLLLRDVLARPLTTPGLRSLRGVVVPHRHAPEVVHPVTGARVAAWYVVGAPLAAAATAPASPGGRHRSPGPVTPTGELRRVQTVARLIGRQVVVARSAPFVVVCAGQAVRVDVGEVDVLGYDDTWTVLRAEMSGQHAEPSVVDGVIGGQRLHVLPFGTRVDAVGMLERDGPGWRLRATPARVPGVVAHVRPG